VSVRLRGALRPTFKMDPYGVLWGLMVSYGVSCGVLWCLMVSLVVSVVVSRALLLRSSVYLANLAQTQKL
jgi:hypothetical protein